MSKFDLQSSFKRLRSNYRLVIMNDDSFEEVATFKLNRITVYIIVSTIFILLIGATVALLWFTPLKQLTPGYKQGFGVDAKYKKLKVETDSVFKIMEMQQNYIKNVKTLLLDQQPGPIVDTGLLQLENTDLPAENNTKTKKNEN